MLSRPLAAQAGYRSELLQHEQQDADCIARLAVRGIATDGEVREMRQVDRQGRRRAHRAADRSRWALPVSVTVH